MQIKKYTAPSMREALLMVKRELGENAFILGSKKVSRGGLLGLGKEMIEVTAAVDDPLSSQNSPSRNFSQDLRTQTESYRRWGRTAAELGGDKPDYRGKSMRQAVDLELLKGEMEDLREAVRDTAARIGYSHPSLPVPLRVALNCLIANGVEEEIAENLVQDVHIAIGRDAPPDTDLIDRSLLDRIAQVMVPSGPTGLKKGRGPSIAVLIGPTGVGKTTTLAKLAANGKFSDNKKVALISADTYRIAAVEQLSTFADIAKIPMEVAYTPDEMREAVARHRDKDLILVDTVGRSQKNLEQLLKLKELIRKACPNEVHLVISANMKCGDVLEAVKNFGIMPVDRLLFTKLDETSSFGTMLNVVQTVRKPISYVTDGQNVPEDIALADSRELAKRILGNSN